MRQLAALGIFVADAGAVVTLRPDVAVVAATVSRPHAAVAQHGVDGALLPVVGALVWLAAAWLFVGLAAGVAARLPGFAGRLGAVVAGRLLPRAVLAVVSGSAGVGLLLAPVAAAAPAHAPGPDRPSPAWPVSSTSAPAWPTTGTATTPPTSPPPRAPRSPANPAQPSRRHQPSAAQAGIHTVQPGDSLWTIAGAQLGSHATPARVAREWPRWFAANRTVIGADPDLLHPGQVLRSPAPAHSSDPSSPETRP